jgi:hypothetical protein
VPDADRMADELMAEILATDADLNQLEKVISRTRYLPDPPTRQAHGGRQSGLTADRAAVPQPGGLARGPAAPTASVTATRPPTPARRRQPHLTRPRSDPAQEAELEL